MNIYCIRPKGYNIGNDIIFLSMKYFIQKAFGFMPNLIAIPATAKYEDNKRAGLTSKTIHEINQYGDGVIIGGGNLYENNEIDVDLNALDTLEVPLFLFSLSRGRIYNKEGLLRHRTDTIPDEKLKALISKSLLSYVRDIATKKYIEALTYKECEISACPTLFVNDCAYILPHVTKEDNDLLLISIRNPDLMNIPVNWKNDVANYIRQIIEIYKGKYNIKLLCHDYRDIRFAESFDNVKYVYTNDIYRFLSILRNCAINISFRLHSTLPCLSFCKLVVNISYDERASSLLETIGYKDWDINIMDSESVIDDIQDRINNFEKLITLKKENEKLWKDFYGIISDAFLTFSRMVV